MLKSRSACSLRIGSVCVVSLRLVDVLLGVHAALHDLSGLALIHVAVRAVVIEDIVPVTAGSQRSRPLAVVVLWIELSTLPRHSNLPRRGARHTLAKV